MNKRTKEDWRKLFNSYDRDLNDEVSKAELEKLMCYCGFNPTKKEIDEMTLKGSDTIDFEEFYQYAKKQPDPMGELRDAFNVFDTDGDGSIDVEEFRKILHDGHEKTTKEIQELIDLVDTNKDGKLQYEEFVKIWCDS